MQIALRTFSYVVSASSDLTVLLFVVLPKGWGRNKQ